MVRTILTKPEYLGYTVNFRTSSRSYKERKNIINPPEQWAVFEGTQEPLVDLETWQLCQRLLETPRRFDTIGESNPLTGLVFCADCGAKMYNHRARPYVGKDGKNNSGFDSYDCSNYKLNKDRVDKQCCSHHINARSLRELLLFTIRTVSQYAISNKEDFIARVREASALRQDNTVKEVKRKLNKDKRRYEELDVLYKRLYESYAIGKISEEKFDMLSNGYEKEQKDLKTAIAAAERSVSEFEKDSVSIDGFLSLAAKYTDFTELTASMLNEFVEKIFVHAPDRSTGERTQEVEVYLNFIGNIEVPAPEPTPEELEQMKIDQYWKDRYWKRRDYELARRKRKLQEKKAMEAAEIARHQESRIKALTEEIRQHSPEMPFETKQAPSA